MNREEEIVIETLAQEFQSVTPKVPSPINSAYGMGFYEGAHWADEHPAPPSEETIRRVLEVFFTECDQCVSTNDFENNIPVVDEVVKDIKSKIQK